MKKNTNKRIFVHTNVIHEHFTSNTPTLQEQFGVGHSRDSEIQVWALKQGHSGVGHSKDTLNLGTPGTTAGMYSGIGHSRRILGLGTGGITPRILWGWALILKGWVSELGAARPGRDRARSSC